MECCREEAKPADPSERQSDPRWESQRGEIGDLQLPHREVCHRLELSGDHGGGHHGNDVVHQKKFRSSTPRASIPSSPCPKMRRSPGTFFSSEPGAHLVQVMDAKNLRRGLLISIQLLEMGLSFLAVLNMWDEARSRGIEIQTRDLVRTIRDPHPQDRGHATEGSGEDQGESSFPALSPRSL